jgi:tetratricopeptide (TPR) repeat protein
MTKHAYWSAILCAPLVAAVISTAAFAQPAPSSNYTSFEAISAKPVQLGYYASAHKDCTPAPLATIRVIEAPKSGTLTVRRGELKTDQVAGCPGLKMPAQIAFYQARAGSIGADHLVYEVTNSTREVARRVVWRSWLRAATERTPEMNRKQRRAAAGRKDVQTICALGDRALHDGRVADAVRHYRQALAMKPDQAKVHNNLANMFQQQGHLADAVAQYRKAIALEPQQALFYNNLANIFVECGRLAQGIELYRTAIALQPGLFEAHNGIGLALCGSKQHEEAIAHFRIALDIKPGSLETRISLGPAYLDLDRKVDALDEAEKASLASERPDFPHRLLGALMVRCGCIEAAQMCFNAYLAGDPEDRQGVRLLLAGLDDGPLPERTSLAQLEEIYRRRANLWHQGAVGPTGYRGHALVAGLLERLNGGARGLDIVDAGCGTGLVGRLGRRQGPAAGRRRRLARDARQGQGQGRVSPAQAGRSGRLPGHADGKLRRGDLRGDAHSFWRSAPSFLCGCRSAARRGPVHLHAVPQSG